MQKRIPPTLRWLKLVFTSLFTLLAALFAFAERPVAANSGGPPASRTGAPGEPTCAMVACHNSFAPNSGPSMLTITGLPATYTPNQQVTVTITLRHPDAALYGFEVTAVDDQGRAAGTLNVTEANRTRKITGTAQGNLREYIQHTALGIAPNGQNQNSWTLSWQTPAQSVGRVRFFAAGNAADSSGDPTGDYIYTTNVSAEPGSTVAAVATVSAASFTQGSSSESIAALFASGGLSGSTITANTLPLPTELGGVRVSVKDAGGAERNAPLFFVAPAQINFLTPQGTGAGTATITVLRDNAPVGQGTVSIETVTPGLFSANASGQGVAAAVMLRVKADGSQTVETIARFNSATNRVEAVPIDFGPETDRLFLILFGTGFRSHTGLSNVNCTIGGTSATVDFAGAQGDLAGLDQANIQLPRSLAGRNAALDLVFRVDGKTANTVQIAVK